MNREVQQKPEWVVLSGCLYVQQIESIDELPKEVPEAARRCWQGRRDVKVTLTRDAAKAKRIDMEASAKLLAEDVAPRARLVQFPSGVVGTSDERYKVLPAPAQRGVN